MSHVSAPDGPSPVPDTRSSPASGLLIAFLLVGFGMVGSRVLGVLRTVAIGNAFGSDPELGAYWVAFRVPDLIFQVLAGATLGSAFIPVFIRLYRGEGAERAWQLASRVLTIITAATAALCVIAYIFAPWLVPLTAPDLGKDVGRHDELTGQAISLTRFMLLSPLLLAMSGMITGILNARQRFLLPALAPMLYNLGIIFGALALSDRWGVEGLATGVVLGAALHLAIQVPGLVRERMRFQPSLTFADPAVREVARLMGPRVIGLAAGQMNFVVTIFFASRVGSDTISHLNYAWLIAGLPLAIFGVTISTAVFPRLAEQVADGDLDALNRTVSRSLRTIMFLTIPATLGLILLRHPATATLLQHGEFTAADTAVVASALGWYCLGIIPQAGIEIHSRGFYALGDTRTPVTYAVVAVLLNLALSATLVGPFEHEGLAFAISAASWVEWALLYAIYNRRTGAHPGSDLRILALFALSGALMSLGLSFTLVALEGRTWFDALLQAAAGSLAGAFLYHAFAALLRVPGFAEQGERVLRLLARGRLRRP